MSLPWCTRDFVIVWNSVKSEIFARLIVLFMDFCRVGKKEFPKLLKRVWIDDKSLFLIFLWTSPSKVQVLTDVSWCSFFFFWLQRVGWLNLCDQRTKAWIKPQMIFKQMKKKIWKTGVDLQSMAELDRIWWMQRQFCLVKSIIRREKILCATVILCRQT